MGVLESVLAYKAQKDAQNSADINAIPAGINAFVDARQKAQTNLLQQLTLKGSLAKEGFRINPQGNDIVADPTLISEKDKLANQETMAKIDEMKSNKTLLDKINLGNLSSGSGESLDASVSGVTNGKARVDFDTPKEQMTRASQLRKEFQASPEVKNYMDVRALADIANKSYESWKAGDTKSANAIDQAIVGALGRGLDPGVSVREAEYQRTPENMSLVNRFQAGLQKIKNGGVMNDAEREGAVFVLNTIADQRGKLYNESFDYYTDSAKNEFRVKPELVTGRFKRHESNSKQKKQTNQDNDLQSLAKSKGVTVRFK